MADDNRGLGSPNVSEETKERVAHEGGEARKQDANYSKMGQKGGQSQGKDNNPSNFANRSEEDVEDAGRTGGEH